MQNNSIYYSTKKTTNGFQQGVVVVKITKELFFRVRFSVSCWHLTFTDESSQYNHSN